MGGLRGMEMELESREGKGKAELKRLGLISKSRDNVIVGLRTPANTLLVRGAYLLAPIKD